MPTTTTLLVTMFWNLLDTLRSRTQNNTTTTTKFNSTNDDNYTVATSGSEDSFGDSPFSTPLDVPSCGGETMYTVENNISHHHNTKKRKTKRTTSSNYVLLPEFLFSFIYNAELIFFDLINCDETCNGTGNDDTTTASETIFNDDEYDDDDDDDDVATLMTIETKYLVTGDTSSSMNYFSSMKGIIKLQAMTRGMILRKEMRQDLLEGGVTFLQAQVRGWIVRLRILKQLQEEKEQQQQQQKQEQDLTRKQEQDHGQDHIQQEQQQQQQQEQQQQQQPKLETTHITMNSFRNSRRQRLERCNQYLQKKKGAKQHP